MSYLAVEVAVILGLETSRNAIKFAGKRSKRARWASAQFARRELDEKADS